MERRSSTTSSTGRAHIFLCVRAYHLLVAIEKGVSTGGRHTSWATLREHMSTHQVAAVVLLASDDRILKIRKAPPARAMSAAGARGVVEAAIAGAKEVGLSAEDAATAAATGAGPLADAKAASASNPSLSEPLNTSSY